MQGIDIAKTMLNWSQYDNRVQLEEFFKSESINGDISIDPSNIAWCSAFMNACERSSGKTGTGRLNARSWLAMGTEIDISDALSGDIIIWDFEHDGTHGHVTYFVSAQDNEVTCLGGNQSNMVKYSTYNVSNLIGVRRT